MHRVRFTLPARVLSETSAMLKPTQLRGELQVQADNLLFSSTGFAGAAVVSWLQASSALSQVVPLGDYRLALDGAKGRVHIALSTSSGTLLLEGDGNWLPAQGLEFHGKAQASPGNYDSLTELLHHLGPEIAPGVHAFNFAP